MLDPPLSAAVPPTQSVSVPLAGGTLRVDTEHSDLPLTALCGFASRRNPKRPFLFVSRVLGRHLPVAPATLHDVHARLAAKLPGDLPGPVVVIGLAETAVALGQGVHAAWRERTGRDDALFLHSTRYRLDHPLLGTFDESHSHATEHLLYWPAGADTRALLAEARSLVLVDDEASTGATFVALTQACRSAMPRLQTLACVTITDWMGAERRAAVAGRLPVDAVFVSLLQGRFSFAPSDAPPPIQPHVTGNGAPKDHLLPGNWGRLGLRAPPSLPPHVEALTTRPGERILVLGTGEFVYPPYQLARRLEAMGAEVRVQASTRSPILPGGAIADALEFPDAYEDAIPNFLYGIQAGQYDRVLICYETPPSTAQHRLIEAVSGEPVHFNPVHLQPDQA
ncbi:phosphoribosyltransferase domain-containing protein [uncultured Rhodospira sp.]|uniref:phosphoribosyltransferase domain-containing protein n=1 Tax=uncultured Rhodospira sp. TaxID=1936189 RepID=UPI00261865BD|nr:phosphoribosyltransferase domain-containing protein [uncultured Rhodospira sp.]